MIDQLKIGEKSSYDDFGASVKSRTIKPGKKKSIKETVPFSNKTYDFSAINGELYWEEQTLEYEFEILADTPEELEEKRMSFAAWVMNAQEEKIYDPFIKDFHFVGTYDDMDYSDDESVEKTTVKVIFTAYPYKIANEEKVYQQTVAAGGEDTIVVVNNSSHRLSPTITVDSACSISVNGNVFNISAGTYTGDSLWLIVGETTFIISNPSATTACVVTIRFFEEVF